MKQLLVISGIGLGLFVATAAGLLAAQGRLSKDGLKSIPLLSAWLGNKSNQANPDGGASNAHATTGQATGQGPSVEGREPGAQGPQGASAADSEQPRLAPADQMLPFRKATPLATGQSGTDAHAGDPKAVNQPKRSAIEPKQAETTSQPDARGRDGKLRDKPSDWEQKAEDLLGQGRYRRGRLFHFPSFEAGLGVDELNAILRKAQEKQDELDVRDKALELKKQELEAREVDVRDRQKDVAEKLAEVVRKRTELERELEDFRRTVLLIRQDEEKGLKEMASSVAKLEPKQAGDLILRMWQKEEGQTKAVKLLTVMDTDSADAILATFSTDQIKDVLEKRMKVVRTEVSAKTK